MKQFNTHTPARRQAGLTLIEFMVSIVIGMILVAALATLIANQSSTRAEIDKSGRMIENGRYALQTITNDMQMAGYWGELTSAPASTVLPDPCSVTLADLQGAMGVHVQGYNAPTTPPSCITNQKAGTDIVVVRKLDPDMSDWQTGGVLDLTKLATFNGQAFMQTGMDTLLGTQLTSVFAVGDSGTNAATFALKKKDKTTLANVRKLVVHIYYVSTCSVEVSGSCTNGDGGSPIPTLKRLDLGVVAGAPAFLPKVTIAEGIEDLQIDYGLDTDGDGSPNGNYVNGAECLPDPTLAPCPLYAGPTPPTYPFALLDWTNVVTMKIHLLARSNDLTAGFIDTKVYALGTASAASAAVGSQGYKRHVFVQSVRLVNPASRRVL